MDEGAKISDIKTVVLGHQICQTRDAKWLCLENIYQKLHRPNNFYDIGGTYIQDVADYWFLYKVEQVHSIFLIHLFITNRQEGAFSLKVSFSSDMNIDSRKGAAHLSTSLKEFEFKSIKDSNQHYITTYSFSTCDVSLLQNKKLYIAISFTVSEERDLSQSIIEQVKLSHDFGALLTDPIGSDFTIESSDAEKFKVHKVLLSVHSEVFKAMLKEDTAESQNSYVKLVDVTAEDLCRILEFIYTGTIKDLKNCNFFNLLMLADQYNVTGLRELAQYALAQQLNTENAIEVLIVADMYNSSVLKSAALKFIRKNTLVFQTEAFKEMNNVELVRELCQYMVPSL